MKLYCDTFGSLWQHARLRLGFSGVDHNVFNILFSQFKNYLGCSRSRWSFLRLLWLLRVWLIWKERNNRIFINVYTSILELTEKVKF